VLTHRTNKQEQTHIEQQHQEAVVVSSLLQTQEGYPQPLADSLAKVVSLGELRGCQLLSDKSKPRNRGGFLRRCLEEKWDTQPLVVQHEAKNRQKNLFDEAALAEVDREQEVESQRRAEEEAISMFDEIDIENAVQAIKESLPPVEAIFLEGKTVHTSRSLRSMVAAFLSSE
jgi:hypothetical protein